MPPQVSHSICWAYVERSLPRSPPKDTRARCKCGHTLILTSHSESSTGFSPRASIFIRLVFTTGAGSPLPRPSRVWKGGSMPSWAFTLPLAVSRLWPAFWGEIPAREYCECRIARSWREERRTGALAPSKAWLPWSQKPWLRSLMGFKFYSTSIRGLATGVLFIRNPLVADSLYLSARSHQGWN